jgi:hypothetical protein
VEPVQCAQGRRRHLWPSLPVSSIDALTDAQQRQYRRNTFFGMEHVQDTHRLALMNLMLHGIRYGDTSCHRSP